MFIFLPLSSTPTRQGFVFASAQWEPCTPVTTGHLLFLTNRGGAGPIESFYLDAESGDVYRIQHAQPYVEFQGTWCRVRRTP